jgi:hypothetical protein
MVFDFTLSALVQQCANLNQISRYIGEGIGKGEDPQGDQTLLFANYWNNREVDD